MRCADDNIAENGRHAFEEIGADIKEMLTEGLFEGDVTQEKYYKFNENFSECSYES